MRRVLATVTIAAMATALVGIGIAVAAELEVVPATPEPGDVELTIDVRDFEPDTPIYALPCDVPESGDAADITNVTCDVGAVITTTTDADGSGTFVVTWTIPDDGLGIYVSDEMGHHEVTTILMTDATTGEPETVDVEVLGTNVVQEDLPETGAGETMVLLMVAASLLALGGLSSGLGRRLGLVTDT